jgi:hypothetical protein
MCSAYVQRRLEAAGWQVAREVRIEDGRYVGWIDLLAFHAPTATLLVIEVKTQIEDVGAIERSIDWHIRGARRAAERLGWRAGAVGAWVTALASDESRKSCDGTGPCGSRRFRVEPGTWHGRRRSPRRWSKDEGSP